MVLPIIIGCAITVAALTVRSGLRAWQQYKALPLFVIARMNNIHLENTSHIENDRRFYSSRLSVSQRLDLERYEGGFNSKMTEAEALLILAIPVDSIKHLNESILKKKHRNAIFKNHSDKGGSPYLSMKINEAREVLSNSVIVKKQ